ncbi:MAG: hypothetical protein JSW52_03865 [Candidatus Coatesbacteria bacterium]|nr:MAG: hypothetical protein JSW52_03865 [Candidatus Coatesbacteria bacterium]
MHKGILWYIVSLAVVASALAASPTAITSTPAATKPVAKTPAEASTVVAAPGGFVLGSPGSDLPKGWYKAEGANCYLIYSDYGIYGGIGFTEDYGFHYNLDVYTDPEHYNGYYSWTDSPSLYDYEVMVYTATCTPNPVSLPGGASSIVIEYAAKWDIEKYSDGCELVYATETPDDDNKEIWQNLFATSTQPGTGLRGQPETDNWYYSGNSLDWVAGETADITSLKGQDVYLGFVFRSDQSNIDGPEDGIYIDDFRVIANGTDVIYENEFEQSTSYSELWDTFRYKYDDQYYIYGTEDWGFSEAMPADINFLRAGEFVVGNSTAYVADPYEGYPGGQPDWTVERAYTEGGHQVVVFSNSDTVRIGDPEFEVSAHVYPQEDFVIVDCYVKSLRQGMTSNIYGGVAAWLQVLHNPYETFNDDVVTYDSSRDMAIYKDPGGENDPLVGFAYLTPDVDSSSVNFKKTLNFTDDAMIYTLLSNGEHDFNGVDSEESYWVVVVGKGPYALTRCQTFRYTFAFIGADDIGELEDSYDDFVEPFSHIIDDQTPVNIQEKSLGAIKSMFR